MSTYVVLHLSDTKGRSPSRATSTSASAVWAFHPESVIKARKGDTLGPLVPSAHVWRRRHVRLYVPFGGPFGNDEYLLQTAVGGLSYFDNDVSVRFVAMYDGYLGGGYAFLDAPGL